MSSKKKKVKRVALAGRRNVGKSTLFNALLGKQRAITDNHPGLTRDILEAEIVRDPYLFLLSDTPGLDIERPDQFEEKILGRAKDHIQKMDLILLLFESPHPLPFDFELMQFIRKHAGSTPLLYVVNKVDGKEHETHALSDFYSAGIHDPIPVSAKGRWNLDLLLSRMADLLPDIHKPDAVRSRMERISKQSDDPLHENETSDLDIDEHSSEEDSTTVSDLRKSDTRVALVGRPNAGKSSLLNRLVGEEVSLVSDIPGTTRDTVDTIFTYHGTTIRMIDTAGMRRTAKVKESGNEVEFYSVARTRRAVRDSKIVIHLIDALEGITDFDKKISQMIADDRKPVILAVNKWDAYPDKHEHSMEEYRDRLLFLFPHAKNFPVIFISALTGQRLNKLIDEVIDLNRKMKVRVPTGKLNALVAEWNRKLAFFGNSPEKIYYASQVESEPPLFIFFVKDKDKFKDSAKSFFENRIRKEYEFSGVPLTILLRDGDEESSNAKQKSKNKKHFSNAKSAPAKKRGSNRKRHTDS